MALDVNDIEVQDFKDHFVRDFVYTDNISTGVVDADIEKAFKEAKANFNQSLFSSDESRLIAFLYIGFPAGEFKSQMRPSFEDRTVWME